MEDEGIRTLEQLEFGKVLIKGASDIGLAHDHESSKNQGHGSFKKERMIPDRSLKA